MKYFFHVYEYPLKTNSLFKWPAMRFKTEDIGWFYGYHWNSLRAIDTKKGQ
jgi:hypothetical protein